MKSDYAMIVRFHYIMCTNVFIQSSFVVATLHCSIKGSQHNQVQLCDIQGSMCCTLSFVNLPAFS